MYPKYILQKTYCTPLTYSKGCCFYFYTYTYTYTYTSNVNEGESVGEFY